MKGTIIKMKKVKITTIILAIVLISLISFGGIYIKKQNRMEDIVKEYSLGRELKGERLIELKVAQENDNGETVVKPEDLTVENYQTVKNTIEKRLKKLGAKDYTISLNKEDGTIRVELPEDETTDDRAYYLIASGKVQIKEKDTDNELLNDSMVKKAQYTYKTNSDGAYQVYLEILLTKEGQAQIDEIKNNYAILATEVDEIEKTQNQDNNTDEQSDTETTTEDTESTETDNNNTSTEETKKILHESIGRILSIASIHDIICQQKALDSETSLTDTLTLLLNQLKSLIPEEKRVSLRLEGDEILLPYDAVCASALAVNELVCNALEHAFDEKEEGNIVVSIHGGSLYHTVTVADDGCGFDVRSVARDGLGMRMIEATVKDRLHGSFFVRSDENGTAVSFEIAVEK